MRSPARVVCGAWIALSAACAHAPAKPATHASPPPKKEVPGPEPDLSAIQAEVEKPAPSTSGECKGATPGTARASTFIWPVDGVVIGAYGHRDGAPHDGIDIAAPEGTAIWASAAGEVIFSGEQPGYGRIVIVRHASDLVTVYAHNAKNCVADGAKVAQGDVVALVGESGGATSPQVHFEVRVGQTAVNPYKHLPE